MNDNLDVTIAVVPHEFFSLTVPALESVLAHTPQVPLIYVDGGSHGRIQRYLERRAAEKDFALLRTEHYLTPNQARNLALERIKTKYVVFLDSDAIVSQGWLEPLVECAQETGAWVVGGLTMYNSRQGRVIHAGAKVMQVEEVDGRGVFSEENHLVNKKLSQSQPLQRAPCTEVEFHCVLVRRSCFETIGLLDEELLCTREHCDLCLTVRQAGGEIYFEPRTIVELRSVSLKLSDLPFFLLRWSESWTAPSIKHFKQKWKIADDDPMMETVHNWITDRRQSFWRSRPLLVRLTRGRISLLERYVLAPLEMRLNAIIARRVAARGRIAGPARMPLKTTGSQRTLLSDTPIV